MLPVWHNIGFQQQMVSEPDCSCFSIKLGSPKNLGFPCAKRQNSLSDHVPLFMEFVLSEKVTAQGHETDDHWSPPSGCQAHSASLHFKSLKFLLKIFYINSREEHVFYSAAPHYLKWNSSSECLWAAHLAFGPWALKIGFHLRSCKDQGYTK